MKNEAESRGAEEAPISGTLGTESGRGVVSIRTDWLKLGGEVLVGEGRGGGGRGVPWLSGGHREGGGGVCVNG